MQLNKYFDNLPDYVLLNGEFCVTEYGDKQPYDPFLKRSVSARDKFYSLEELVVLDLSQYETLGIKASNGISMIDIDDCVVEGVINDFAVEIIEKMKTYTELSPSGKGIRLIFKNLDKFDFEKYKTKNSKIGLEFYDADDQEVRGARMCRLSGDRINAYEFRPVKTKWLLDEYMIRDVRNGIRDGLVDEEVDWNWVDLVTFLLRHRSDAYQLFNREIDIFGESEWDLMISNMIGEYTNNINEIMEIFKNTRYYRTKGVKSSKAKHKQKWDGEYGWNTVGMSNPEKELLIRDQRKDVEWTVEDLIKVGIEFNLTSAFYYKGRAVLSNASVDEKLKPQLLFILRDFAGSVGVLTQKRNIKMKILELL